MAGFNHSTTYQPVGSSNSFEHPDMRETRSVATFNINTDATIRSSKALKHKGSSWQRMVTHLWILEWLSWSVALLSMAGIVGVLAAFDQRPIPNWPYGITLGALVSLLATIANVGLAGPIGAGLGQAKWLWFTRERKMADFELIDDASRGPYKSAILLARGKGGVVAIFGAILTILTLAVGPFVQQVVQYQNNLVNSTAASVPIATQYDTFNGDGGILETDVALGMKAAIQRGLLDINADATNFFVSPQCPTGNCTWTPYTTLSVCARCTDLTSQLKVVNNNDSTATTSLPNGLSLSSTPGITQEGLIAMAVNNTYTANVDSIAYKEWQGPLADVFTIVAEYSHTGPFASECIVQFCIRDHSASVVNGTFKESELNTPRYFNYSDTTNLTDGGKNYSIEFNTYKGFGDYFESLFNTQVHQTNGLSPVSEWPDGTSQALFYWTNGTSDHLPIQMFDNLADSMSLNVRSAARASSPGVASSLQSVISVDWYWMILPLGLLALTFVYLLTVVCVSRASNQEPWKTSSVAVLMHGLMDDESRSLVKGIERLDDMDDTSEQLKMKIVRKGLGGAETDEYGTQIGFIAR